MRSTITFVGSVLLLMLRVSGLEECYKESFDGSFGLFDGSCGSGSFPFTLELYDDYKDVFTDIPSDSGGYFIKSAQDSLTCSTTSLGIKVPADSELFLKYYSHNFNNTAILRLTVKNFDNGGYIQSKTIYVDGSATWKTETLTISKANNIQIQIQIDTMEVGEFVAIDSLTIKTPELEDCPFERITTTQQTTSQGTTESSTTTEEPTVTTPIKTTPPITTTTTLTSSTHLTGFTTTPKVLDTTTTPSISTTPPSTTTERETIIPPLDRAPGLSKWEILSIIAVSLAGFVILCLLCFTLIFFRSDKEKKPSITENVDGSTIPRLALRRGISTSGESTLEIIGV